MLKKARDITQSSSKSTEETEIYQNVSMTRPCTQKQENIYVNFPEFRHGTQKQHHPRIGKIQENEMCMAASSSYYAERGTKDNPQPLKSKDSHVKEVLAKILEFKKQTIYEEAEYQNVDQIRHYTQQQNTASNSARISSDSGIGSLDRRIGPISKKKSLQKWPSFKVDEKGGQFNIHQINVQMIFLEGDLPNPTWISVEQHTSDEMLQSCQNITLTSTILDIKPHDAVLSQPATLKLPVKTELISGENYKVLQWIQGNSKWVEFPVHDNCMDEACMILGEYCFLNIAQFGKYAVVTTTKQVSYEFASENCNNNNGNDSDCEECEHETTENPYENWDDTNDNGHKHMPSGWYAMLNVEKMKDDQFKAIIQITKCLQEDSISVQLDHFLDDCGISTNMELDREKMELQHMKDSTYKELSNRDIHNDKHIEYTLALTKEKKWGPFTVKITTQKVARQTLCCFSTAACEDFAEKDLTFEAEWFQDIKDAGDRYVRNPSAEATVKESNGYTYIDAEKPSYENVDAFQNLPSTPDDQEHENQYECFNSTPHKPKIAPKPDLERQNGKPPKEILMSEKECLNSQYITETQGNDRKMAAIPQKVKMNNTSEHATCTQPNHGLEVLECHDVPEISEEERLKTRHKECVDAEKIACNPPCSDIFSPIFRNYMQENFPELCSDEVIECLEECVHHRGKLTKEFVFKCLLMDTQYIMHRKVYCALKSRQNSREMSEMAEQFLLETKKENLKTKLDYFCKRMTDVKYIVEELYPKGKISHRQKQDIQARDTPEQRAQYFLKEVILRSDSNCFESFVAALRKCNNNDLANMIAMDTEEYQNLLRA